MILKLWSYKANCDDHTNNLPTKEEAGEMIKPVLASMGVDTVDQLSDVQRQSMCGEMTKSFNEANPDQDKNEAIKLVKDLIG